MMQVEVADNLVFDRPVRGWQWFEATMRDQLSLGRPAEVSLLFAWRVTQRTPGRFLTRVVHEDATLTLRVTYKRDVPAAVQLPDEDADLPAMVELVVRGEVLRGGCRDAAGGSACGGCPRTRPCARPAAHVVEVPDRRGHQV